MLTQIKINKNNKLNWELEENLINISNGFEVQDEGLILWVVQDLDNVLSLLKEAKIAFEIYHVNS